MIHVKKSLLLIFLWAISLTSYAMTSQLREIKDDEGSVFAGRYSASGILEAYAAEERTILGGVEAPTPQQRGQLQTLAWNTVRRMAQHTGLSTVEHRASNQAGNIRTTYYFTFNPDWIKGRLADLQKSLYLFNAQNTALQTLLTETAQAARNLEQYDVPTTPMLHDAAPILQEQSRLRVASREIVETEIRQIKAWQEGGLNLWQKNNFALGSGHSLQRTDLFLPSIDPARPIVGYVSPWDADKLASGEVQGIWASLLPHLETLIAGHFDIGNPRPPVAAPVPEEVAAPADRNGSSIASDTGSDAGEASGAEGEEENDDDDQEGRGEKEKGNE